ncbi:mitochondrial dynamics protein MID49 [Esox lucius]|uniref:Mitochondrial elongation factor 1 n=1 Tax=Esox lucius TaxID=8010 RepID=A0A3P9A723_ESOLU|nr:mitochondrial dynamics protein MID49 [Esox lucius]XP_012986832.1 mitochondrial dynamics protein MID49 [Esox lucius]
MDFRGFRPGKSRGEESIAVVVDFLLANARLVLGVGGAVVLGVATLAVKRLIERAGKAAVDEKVEQKMAESWEELSLVSSSPKAIRKGLEGVVMKHVAKATKSQKDDLCRPQKSSLEEEPVRAVEPQRPKILQLSLTLQDRLQQYYSTRVMLAAEEVHRAQSLALDICTEIQGFLHTTQPDMPLGEMSLGGSLLDDLQVVSADHACLLVPVRLEANLWRLIPGEETLLTHPLHWMVRRTNLEYFPRGRSYWDRFLVGGYLSCRVLVSMLSKAVMETMNWPSLSSMLDCQIRPVLGGEKLELEIRPEGCLSPMFISMIPVLRESDVVLTAQVELTHPWDSAWHLSLYPWETQRLAQLDSADQGSRRTLLKTLKAICRHCPALRPLTAAPLANLILHLSEKDLDWSEGALSGRFQQCIWELIGYLEQGVLPSYFKPSVNLLNGVTEEEIDHVGFMLYCAVSEPEILLI